MHVEGTWTRSAQLVRSLDCRNMQVQVYSVANDVGKHKHEVAACIPV